MIISDFKKKKLVDYLKGNTNGRILLLMRHGLGDIVNFLPIFIELKKRFPNWRISLGVEKNRNLSIIHKDIYEYDKYKIKDIRRLFTYIFAIAYREPYGNLISKPMYCNLTEIGLDDFEWNPYKFNVGLNNTDSERVGVHFFGNTNQKNKSLKTEQALKLWEHIESIGLYPFEIHNPGFNDNSSIGYSFIKRDQTIRFENPTIERMIQEISKCKYFVGIDSGVLYLAMSILGPEKCIGIQKNYFIEKYAPININIINIEGDNNWKIFELKKLNRWILNLT